MLKAGRASSNTLLRDVKRLCGSATGLSAISPSPLYIQDEEGRFPCEVARVQGVPVAVFEYLVARNPTGENYHRLIDAIETQEWLLVVNIIGRDPHTTSIEGKPASPGSVQSACHGRCFGVWSTNCSLGGHCTCPARVAKAAGRGEGTTDHVGRMVQAFHEGGRAVHGASLLRYGTAACLFRHCPR